MANEYKNEPIPIPEGILGDKPRSFKWDVNAHEAFEEETGQDLMAVINSMTPERDSDGNVVKVNIPKVAILRGLVWAGLLHEEPRLTAKGVGALMTMNTFTDVAPYLGQSLRQYLPKPPESSTPIETPASEGESRSTGVASTPSPNATSE